MKNYSLKLLVLIFLVIQTSISQEKPLTNKDSIVKSSWIFGLGVNIVDDSGNVFNNPLNVEDQWNAVPYPSRISVGRYFKNGLGLELIGSYNKYKEGKIIDEAINLEDIDYFALDTRLSYDLNNLIGYTGFFDPYIGVGIGYTDANNLGRVTGNGIIGFRTWFSDRFGLDINSSGKWFLNNNATNHIQYAVGIVYQFRIEKGLSKKDEREWALNEAYKKRQKHVVDSIALAKESERLARELAKKQRKEKELARLAKEEKSIMAKETQKKILIENAIKDLGNVYFDLNSSYLNKQSKEVLGKLVLLLKINSTVVLNVKAYTDSRGTDKYNLWLSQRRVERTVDYLITKGIPTDRLLTKAYGEGGLTNECDNFTYCTEDKHQMNRRVEFVVEKF